MISLETVGEIVGARPKYNISAGVWSYTTFCVSDSALVIKGSYQASGVFDGRFMLPSPSFEGAARIGWSLLLYWGYQSYRHSFSWCVVFPVKEIAHRLWKIVKTDFVSF